jgi:hypothetical protein
LCYQSHKKYYLTGENLQKNNRPPEKAIFKERKFQRIFEGIENEIAILTATTKFNFTICKTDKNTLKLTLAYRGQTKTNRVIKKPHEPANGNHKLSA